SGRQRQNPRGAEARLGRSAQRHAPRGNAAQHQPRQPRFREGEHGGRSARRDSGQAGSRTCAEGGLMKSDSSLPTLNLCGFGTARADLAAIAAMRKSLPAWAPKDTAGHFLKHADEQTVLAVAALDNAIQSSGPAPENYRDWA